MRCFFPIALLFAACAPTETGNPEFAAQMSLTADTSESDRVSLGPGGSEVEIDQAWIVVGDVRFVSAAVCDSGSAEQIDIVGPGAVDIASNPMVFSFDTELDDYCRVRVELDRAGAVGPPGAPPELVDHSIAISGTVVAGGTPFLILSQVNREADIRSRGAPFALDETQRAVVLAFDAAVWLAGVDLSTAIIGTDGRIVVDENENDEQMRAFDDNVEQAMRLFRDDDEDGALDPEDRTQLLAQGGP